MKWSKYIMGIGCLIVAILIAFDKVGIQDIKQLLIIIFIILANILLNVYEER